MPVVQKCCFCVSLPTGGITLGWLTVISGILSIASTVFGLINLDKTFRTVANKLNLDITHEEYEMVRSFYKISVIVYLVITIFVTISAILLIVGASRRKGGLILPWLVGSMISIVVNGFFLLAIIASRQAEILVAVCFVVVLALQIYLWICIYALYQLTNEQHQQRRQRGSSSKGSGKRLYPVAMA